jgi:hypothetical protein
MVTTQILAVVAAEARSMSRERCDRCGVHGERFWGFLTGSSDRYRPVITVGETVLRPKGNKIRCKADCNIMLFEPWDA